MFYDLNWGRREEEGFLKLVRIKANDEAQWNFTTAEVKRAREEEAFFETSWVQMYACRAVAQ